MIKKLVLVYVLLLSPTVSFADSFAKSIGEAIGEFGAGVGEVMGNHVSKTISSQQPQWITIMPKTRKECIAESGWVINAVYIRCRNGRQEFVRFDGNGRKIVLSERAIPMY